MMAFCVQQSAGQAVEGPALVLQAPFSARYDLDRTTGVISRSGHPMRGRAIANTILICPAVQGGVAAGWAFLAMKNRGVAPAGLVFGVANPVVVQGAIVAGIAVAAGVDPEAFDEIQTGDQVRLDPATQTLHKLEQTKRK